MSFGWRQPLAATVALAAAAVPIAAGVSWAVRGADDPLTRVTESAVPAFVAAEAETGARPRLLAITPAAGGAVSYALVRGAGPQLGDADRAPTGREDPLGRVVSALVSGTGASVAGALATYGIGYVLLPAEADGDLVAVLNATEGLARSSNADAPDLWEVTAPAGELVVLPPRLGERARAGVAPPVGALLASPPTALEVAAGRTAEVPPGRDGRLLVLAESSDPGWRAEIGGRRLDPLTTWGWAQGFVLPADGGTVRVWHAGGGRTTELVVQGALVALVALLAWPTLGRSDRPPRPRSRRRPPTPAVAAPREPASVGATDGAA